MLRADFVNLMNCLLGADVEFVVVGGYAVAFYGLVRWAEDLDVFYRPSAENVARLVSALRSMGLPSAFLEPELYLEEGWIVQVGVSPKRTDFMSDLEAVTFDEALSSANLAIMDGISKPVPFLSRDLLLKNKRAVGGYKDGYDIACLTAKQPKMEPRIRNL